ncbi:TOMM precursor leader peptide-binding protein [Streptomyces ficellus]|uniref:TOMM leader peptide-binding protein n=1 Tax=Streptomyces ficellus TaxID=1977088 RepID=A0ABT7Z602_9ACTN|nr:TOMM precursor leader peptide-binding protein [Streptomyces ficellus]MDN3294915.1 TOMM precursor leader peptide-binding protein [Streptomyces ficellus]
MNAQPSQPSASAPSITPRLDVRFLARSGLLYVCASTGTLRLRGAFLPGRPEGVDDFVGLDALPEPAVTGLRRRGLLAESGHTPAHPLYEVADPTVLLAGHGPVQDSVRALLVAAGVQVERATVSSTAAARAALVPLSADEGELSDWARWASKTGSPVVTYLSTPTRLLLSRLDPPATPCPVCLVRRLRANHTWQAIADLPLDVILGAADSDAWPTTAIAAGTLAHETLRALSGSAPQEPPCLVELDHASLECTRHRLLHTPHCPGCPADVHPTTRSDATFEAAPEAVPERDSGTDWERMRHAVDPLTGLVAGMLVREDGQPGATTSVYTTGMPTTTWFSPVKAEPQGAANKWDLDTARVCALGETMERYAAGVYDPATLVRSTLAALGEAAVDPRTLPLGSAAEYERLPHYGPFDPDVEIDWVRGVSLTTGRPRYVPACAVYLPYHFPRGHKPWLDSISNGLAAGRNASHAALGGLMELVERDAAVIFWSNRLTLPTLDLSVLPDGPAREMAARLTATGARVLCKDLTTDLGIPVAGVQVLTGTADRPVVSHAARAALDIHDAIQGALEEACLCLYSVETTLETEGVPEPNQDLRTAMDFGRYYCSPERLHHLRFFEDGPLHPPPPPRPGLSSTHAELTEAVERLAATGHETITVDITPIDVHECGVSVLRTIVPGLCPITLRRDFHRRGGPRVFQAPVSMSARTSPLTEEELNPMPHPFL